MRNCAWQTHTSGEAVFVSHRYQVQSVRFAQRETRALIGTRVLPAPVGSNAMEKRGFGSGSGVVAVVTLSDGCPGGLR
jgi:hypothetical protein